MANKVSITVAVDEEGRLSSSLDKIEQQVRQKFEAAFQGAGNTARKTVDATDESVSKLRANLDRTEQSLRNVARQYDDLAAKAQSVSAAADARNAASLARGQAANLGNINDTLPSIGPIDATKIRNIERDAQAANQSISALRTGASRLRDELDREPAASGLLGRTGTIVQSILLRDVIKDVIKTLGELAQESVKDWQAMSAAQIALTNTSHDYGVSVRENAIAAQSLADANRGVVDSLRAIEIQAAATRLASEGGGRGESAQEISQRAINLAKERGIDSDKIPSLIQSISGKSPDSLQQLTGETDKQALNAYANTVGKLTKDLTEQEKAQARIDAIIRNSDLYNGKAAEQLGAVRRELNRVADDYKSSGLLGFLFKEFTPIGGLQRAVKDARENYDKLNLDVDPTADRRAREAKDERDRQDKLQQDAVEAVVAAKKEADAQTKIRNESINFQARSFVEDQHERLKAQEAAAKKEEETAKKAEALRKRQLEQLEAIRNKFLEIDLPDEKNPFLKIFDKAAKATDRYNKEFGKFKNQFSDIRETLEKRDAATRGDQLGVARIDTNFKALQLRQEADLYRLIGQRQLELTSIEEQRLRVLNAQLNVITQNPRLLAQAEAIERGRPLEKREVDRLNVDEFEKLNKLSKGYDTTTPEGRAAGKAIDEALQKLTVGFDLFALRNSSDPKNRDVAFAAAGVNRRQAARNDESLQDEIQRQAIVEQQQRNARDQIAFLNKVPTSNPFDAKTIEKDKLLEGIFSQLGPKNLTPDLLRGQIAVKEREAAREARSEQRAQEQFEVIKGIKAAIETRLESLEKTVKAGGSVVEVTIDDNRTDERTRQAAGSTDPSDYSASPTDYSDLRNSYGGH